MVNSWMTYKYKFWVNGTRLPIYMFGARTLLWHENIEYNQYFYEYDLTDVFTPDSGNVSMVMKVTNLLREEGTSQILNLVT